jgi:hypothetical protein
MMSRFIEQRPTSWVSENVPGARSVLRNYGIAPDSRMAFGIAAAAASVAPDAILAELGYREQLAVRRLREQEREQFDLEYNDSD